MAVLSYGIETPKHLLKKLEHEANQLTETPHPYCVFNFLLTAAVLAEWVHKYYESYNLPDPFRCPTKRVRTWIVPNQAIKWITERGCFPYPDGERKKQLIQVLAICRHIANASKHFHWQDSKEIQAIGTSPPIVNWSQYFFTSTAPDIYVTIDRVNFGLQQIKVMLLQFYAPLLDYLDEQKKEMGA
ncbi:hypothetical protein Thiowin_02516 [Thiorhodovibrio winogradskyi]|uniref:Uncharacterized protein n=1 Tax=Thiorhodovibrio winogradskyi TaxID=77007 RepID=A0ABZ0SAM8_9GAMM|nr:hypothetical protein [Thiorhodovibrio winogradskyi]